MRSNHTIKESNALDDRLAGLVEMAQNYKANGYSDAQAMEAALGDYERSTGRNIGYDTLEQLYQALEARGFSFPEEELEEATMRRGTKMKESAELTTDQLNSYAAREGLSDMRFLKTKRIGYRDDGTKDVYLTLSLDNEAEYIVGEMLFYYSSSGDPVLRFPPPLFVTTDRIEAIDEFNDYSTSRSRESRRAGGKHALAQKYRMNKNTTEKIRTRESSEKITWSSFDTPESNALEEKYLPANGDGDTMASQAVTAATKLIYKWFNDGDVYDNSYGLSGWANDISGSANWLAKHVPGARDILWRIQKTRSEEEYVSNILWPLFNLVYDSNLLSSLEKKPKVDDAYSCKGPFEFNYEDEDAYQEEDPESFGDYDQDYELDEAIGKKAKLARKQEHHRTRESTGGKYKLEYVLYYRGDVYRKTGSFTAASDQEACKKAAMIQANYGPLKDLDAEARAELEEDVMRDFEEYPEQHSDPIETWDSLITYNSEEFSVRLSAPDGRVLVDTGMDDFADEEDLEESMKTSIDKLLREAAKPVGRDRLGDWYNHSFRERNSVASKPKMKKALDNALFEEDRNYKRTAYSVNKAFPGIDPAAAEIITGWYCAEAAVEDFDTTDDFAEFIKDDVLDMLDAGSDSADVATVKAGLASIGFESFDEDEVDFDESKKPAANGTLREAVADKDWSEFQSDMFNAITGVYERFNMGKGSGESTADKMDLIKVLDWMDAHGFWDEEALDNALFEEGSAANGVRESHDRLPYGDGLHWNSRTADDMLLTVLREIYENANIELPVTIRALVPAELKKSIKFLDRILDLYV